MNCDEAKPHLYDRVLEGVRNNDADAHLASCESCRADLADIELTKKLMRQGMPEEEPARRIAFVADAPVVSRNPLRFWQWSFAGAAAFAMLFAVLAFRRPMVAPAQAGFTQAQVETIVNQAVAASEQRQRAEMAGVIQTAAERMSDQLHYLESSQSQVYKQAEQNHAELRQVTALMGARQQ